MEDQAVDETGHGGSFVVRPMGRADVGSVVGLHRDAFPNNFMTTFGESFLSSFYEGLIAHPEGYGCVVADRADRPVGFCVGGSGDARRLARGMLLRRPLAFVWPALVNVVRSPRRLGRVLSLARSYFGPRSNEPSVPTTALLMQVAVAEDLRGSGAAQRMVESFLNEMRKRGASAVSLGAEADNARAIAFYQRVGFIEARPGIFEYRFDAENGDPAATPPEEK